MYTLGFISTYLVSSLARRYAFTWRNMHSFYLVFAILDCISFFLCSEAKLCPFYTYKHEGREEAEKVVRYLHEKAAKELLYELDLEVKIIKKIEQDQDDKNMVAVVNTVELPMVNNERSEDDENGSKEAETIQKQETVVKMKKKNFSGLRTSYSFLIKHKKEIQNTFKVALFYGMSLEMVFRVYCLYFVTEDIFNP